MKQPTEQRYCITLNVGSSSIKSALFKILAGATRPQLVATARLSGIGSASTTVSVSGFGDDGREKTVDSRSSITDRIPELCRQVITALRDSAAQRASAPAAIAAVVHRVVHGGLEFTGPIIVTPEIKRRIEALTPLAPLHQPVNVAGISALEELFPTAQQIACFDTAFHHGHPKIATMYALPQSHFEAGIRRYGFHGLSIEHVARTLRDTHTLHGPDSRVIVAHLGSGASMCALKGGKSIASTMGFSVLDGLAMGTRCGQIDPGVLLYLAEARRLTVSEIAELLYHRSGLLGISGISSDMRVLTESDALPAKEAVEYFVQEAVKRVGELAALLEGIDGLVFTGGIGENSAVIREAIVTRLGWLGVEIDLTANVSTNVKEALLLKGTHDISAAGSRGMTLVMVANEEQMMATHMQRLLRSST